jgi:hypothetical protein
MAALRVGILRAETIVGIADQGGSGGGSNEGFARQGIDPVGGAGAGGKVMCDGVGIGCILGHLATGETGEERETGRATGGRDLYIFHYIFAVRCPLSHREPFQNVFSTRFQFSHTHALFAPPHRNTYPRPSSPNYPATVSPAKRVRAHITRSIRGHI